METQNIRKSCIYMYNHDEKWVIIPCSQDAKLNFNPSPKSNKIFNPSKLKHDK